MKKIVFLVLGILIIGNFAYCADWSYQILDKWQDKDTIYVKVKYTDGTNIETVDIPVFQPTSKVDVITAITNRKETVRIKQEAIARNKIILPDVK